VPAVKVLMFGHARMGPRSSCSRRLRLTSTSFPSDGKSNEVAILCQSRRTRQVSDTACFIDADAATAAAVVAVEFTAASPSATTDSSVGSLPAISEPTAASLPAGATATSLPAGATAAAAAGVVAAATAAAVVAAAATASVAAVVPAVTAAAAAAAAGVEASAAAAAAAVAEAAAAGVVSFIVVIVIVIIDIASPSPSPPAPQPRPLTTRVFASPFLTVNVDAKPSPAAPCPLSVERDILDVTKHP